MRSVKKSLPTLNVRMNSYKVIQLKYYLIWNFASTLITSDIVLLHSVVLNTHYNGNNLFTPLNIYNYDFWGTGENEVTVLKRA